eukprot:7538-Heterococcus_DN1.PRE.1
MACYRWMSLLLALQALRHSLVSNVACQHYHHTAHIQCSASQRSAIVQSDARDTVTTKLHRSNAQQVLLRALSSSTTFVIELWQSGLQCHVATALSAHAC